MDCIIDQIQEHMINGSNKMNYKKEMLEYSNAIGIDFENYVVENFGNYAKKIFDSIGVVPDNE
jgi:hypothetical protein